MKTRFIFNEVIDRLKKALKIKADYEIAERLNMKAGAFNARKKSDSLPYEELLLLAELEKLDYNWLLTGEGTMLKGGGANENFSDEDVKLLKLIKALAPEQKNDMVKDLEKFVRYNQSAISHFLATNGGEMRAAA